MKRVVVSGCREYNNYVEAKTYIEECLNEFDIKEKIVFVVGGCKGADKLAEISAQENGIDIEIHPAQWEKFGRKAGPLRNKQMVEKSDYVICFWDGNSRGTKSTINYARQHNKPLKIKMI